MYYHIIYTKSLFTFYTVTSCLPPPVSSFDLIPFNLHFFDLSLSCFSDEIKLLTD